MYWNVSNDAEAGPFDRAASSFFVLVTIAFTPPFTVITVWQQERKLVRREVTQNVYALDTFFWAKTLVLIPIETFFTLLVRIPRREPDVSLSAIQATAHSHHTRSL
jgi:hypothetical protein